MPRIHFASNNISHFPGSMPGSVANTFDPTRVPYAVMLTNYQLVTGPEFFPVAGQTTWFHFRSYTDGNPYTTTSASPGIMFQCFDAQNRMVARIMKKHASYIQDLTLTTFNGSTSVSVNSNIPMTQSKVNFIDIAITITPILVRTDLYINGALAATALFGSNPNLMTNPTRFSLGCSHTETLTQAQHFSEILVADGDTRNARMNFLRPVSAGAYSEWDGELISLGDDDPTTGMYTKDAAQRHTMELSGYTGAQNISNLVSVSQTTRGLNSPTRLQHTLRQEGVNYDSANIAIGYALQYNLVDLPLNPATSLPWTAAELVELEVGFRSVA